MSMLQEVRDSSFDLLSIFGPGNEGFSLRDCLAKKKKLVFRVLLEVRLGESRNLLMEDWFFA